MIFKWAKGGQGRAPAQTDSSAVSAQTIAENAAPSDVRHPLSAAALRRSVSHQALGFKTTAELEPINGLIGQDRALRAIQFGADMKANDFNMFVLGPSSTGKSTAVKAYLAGKGRPTQPTSDWIYVNNYDSENQPRAFELPCGRAKMLERGMAAAIDELRATLPALFEGDDYQTRRRAIEELFRTGQETALEGLNRKAQVQNIAILRTPTGFAMAPMLEGKIVKPEVFMQLPEDMRRGVETKIEVLQVELETLLGQVPKLDKERRQKLAALNEEVAAAATLEALDDLDAAFKDLPQISAHLQATRADMIRNVALFLTDSEDPAPVVKPAANAARDPRYRRYLINVLVSGQTDICEIPVIEELNPTYGNLIGRIEHVAQMGTMLTDFLLVKAGALHRANGGYLLLDARKLLLSPYAWEALKRALKAQLIRIELPTETVGMMTAQTLDPEPIPLSVKVVLFGDRDLYYTLAGGDPDFVRLFKVQADFDDTIARSPENDTAYARLIASIVKEHKLRPVEADGVARLIEEGARMADDREKLSIEIGRISDIVREADYWTALEGRETITRADVSKAIDQAVDRASRLRDRSHEAIERNIVMIDTSGAKTGQINGLSVMQLGTFAFGRPARITARVRVGQGRVTDIEREVNLGGPLHSKGVMILWGYLAGRYAEEVPLAMAATLVFEQSYGGVDGDSASSAELYALLSALSDVPIQQCFAVTGSVNQWGEVQAIGGANEKIEGFFDLCVTRGLDGRHGVLIPHANVQHLMLREDVVAAVSEGKFRIHAVSRIDDGIELLTGKTAGERGVDGRFPEGSINALVEDKLRLFATRAKAFSFTKGKATA
jgi:lon-related putative ATP-dependent protease